VRAERRGRPARRTRRASNPPRTFGRHPRATSATRAGGPPPMRMADEPSCWTPPNWTIEHAVERPAASSRRARPLTGLGPDYRANPT
jgi:hypothetical protein